MWARGRSRADDEQGNALVEAVIILPLLMILTFGAIELGIGFNQKAALESISRAGARTGATLAADTNTSVPFETPDNSIGVDTAVAVNAALDTTAVPDLSQLTVYMIRGGVPSYSGGSCTGPYCMIFPYDPGAGKFDTTPSNGGSWLVTDRRACVADADQIAVRIDGTFHWLTGLISHTPVHLTSTTVLQLEPTNCGP